MDPEMQRRFEEYLHAPEVRELPLDERNTYARLHTLNRNDMVFVLDAALNLGFSEIVQLPDGSTLQHLGEVPAGEADVPEIAGSLRSLRHLYVWRVLLPQVSVETVREGYRSVSVLTSLLSFAVDVPIQWRDPSDPPSIHIVSRSPDPDLARVLLEHLAQLAPDERRALKSAMHWYAVGLRIGETGAMVAYEFLSYWNAIESIANTLSGDIPSGDIASVIRCRLADLFPPEDLELEDVVRVLTYRRVSRLRVASAFSRLVGEANVDRFTARLFHPRPTLPGGSCMRSSSQTFSTRRPGASGGTRSSMPAVDAVASSG
jgi:hypothetical protein